jgi:hypothetical protein
MVRKTLDDFYKDFGISKVDRKELSGQLLHNLYKVPKKDRGLNAPHYEMGKKDDTHQIDILFLPFDEKEDTTYKYALVVVDVGTRLVDAEPIDSKKASGVADALFKIYDRKILNKPRRIDADPGKEFKGDFKKRIEDEGIVLHYGEVKRHRQQALAERYNQMIGTALIKRQTAQELLTGERDRQWVDDLPIIVKSINEKNKNRREKKYPNIPTCEGDSCDLIVEGTKVRAQLDEPYDIIEKKYLPNGFRSGDIRWNPKIQTVTNIMIRPGQPPLYILDNHPVAYTKNQLQVVPKNEKVPPMSVIRGNPTKWNIKEILDKKKKYGKWVYTIQWVAGDEISNVPEENIVGKIDKKMLDEFEKKWAEKQEAKKKEKEEKEAEKARKKKEQEKKRREEQPNRPQPVRRSARLANKK